MGETIYGTLQINLFLNRGFRADGTPLPQKRVVLQVNNGCTYDEAVAAAREFFDRNNDMKHLVRRGSVHVAWTPEPEVITAPQMDF